MSEQQPAASMPAGAALRLVCRSCGRRTWSTSGDCATCAQVRVKGAQTEDETVPAAPDPSCPDIVAARPVVTVLAGLGWPSFADAHPSSQLPGSRQLPGALGWITQARVPITEAEGAAVGPITVAPADLPLVPLGLPENALSPVADRERTMSWWDELLADGEVDGVGANPGWLKRHWHGIRAILVITLVSLMAVLYSGTGLVVVWAVLVIPALAVRLYKHHHSRSALDQTQAAPLTTSSA